MRNLTIRFRHSMCLALAMASLLIWVTLPNRYSNPALPLGSDISSNPATETYQPGGMLISSNRITAARISEAYGRLPISFEANHGQLSRGVRFFARGSGYNLFLTPAEAVIQLQRTEEVVRGTDAPIAGQNHHRKSKSSNQHSAVLRMKLMGANTAPQVVGFDQLPQVSNYFLGKSAARWRTGVPSYARVKYREVYKGVDLVYYGNQRELEYDFIVAPGADPRAIRIAFDGADSIKIDVRGDLVLGTGGNEIRQRQPVVYQEVDGIRQEIVCRYSLLETASAIGGRHAGKSLVGFEIAEYDKSKPLIIDPVLSYSTYLGGGDDDAALSIALDPAGGAYVTGFTRLDDFPTTPGALRDFNAGAMDAFVAKLNPAGTELVYSTYLGGSGFEGGFAIAVDLEGNAYVTGSTDSTDFPTTDGAFQTVSNISSAFVAKLNATGTALLYSTYLGGSNFDQSRAIQVDAAGFVFVAGWSGSKDFPTTQGALQPGMRPGSSFDGFVTKLNAEGSGLIYSTYLGGAGFEVINGMAIGSAGNAYVTGFTDSTDFPTTRGAFQTSRVGGDEAFVAKVNAAGSALVYSTYLGGFGNEEGKAIAVDSAGNAYVTGATMSRNFPTTAGAFQPSFQSLFGGDAFVTKLNASGAALVYSTYLGGNSDTVGHGIAIDPTGHAYVTGETLSTRFPTENALQTTSGSGPSFKSTDGGSTWQVSNAGIISEFVSAYAIDPFTPWTIYAATDAGIFKSTDAGSGWRAMNNGLGNRELISLAIDPRTPSTLYAGAFGFDTKGGLFKSTNGGASWRVTGLATGSVGSIAIDPSNPAVLYACVGGLNEAGVFKSTNGGGAWSFIRIPASVPFTAAVVLAIDPQTPTTIYVGTNRQGVFKSTNSGASWSATGLTDPSVSSLAIDPITPSILYAGTSGNGIFKSTDGGSKWVEISAGLPDLFISSLEIDPTSPSVLYAGGSSNVANQGVFRSTDGGSSWTATSLKGARVFSLAVDPVSTSTIFTGVFINEDAFVTRLNPTGTRVLYSTFLGGFSVDAGSSIAVDSSGNAYVAGWTVSTSFPTTEGVIQKDKAGGFQDAFVVRIELVQGQTIPEITGASIRGKKLFVSGRNFDQGAKVFVDGKPKKTSNDAANPDAALIAKKAGKKINPGQKVVLQVENPDGARSPEFIFMRPVE